MKTLYINIAVASIFLLGSLTVNAQSNKTKSTSVKQRTEAKVGLNKETTNTSNPTAVSSKSPQRPVKFTDYMGMEKKIMTWSIAGDIPASLPKYVTGQTKAEYQLLVKNWAKKNLNLIKEEYHAKILAKPRATSNTK